MSGLDPASRKYSKEVTPVLTSSHLDPYWKRLFRNMKTKYELYLFVLPALITLILFHYAPIYGLQIAFKDFVPFQGILGSDWVGLKHFVRFVGSYQFWDLIKNTALLSLYIILFTFPLPVFLAILVNQLKDGLFKKSVQTIAYMPHFISSVVVVGMLLVFLSPRSGVINHLIEMFGGERFLFMGSEGWFRPLFVLSEIWQQTGWDSIIFIAALSTIDQHLYEAARVDGASRWKQILHIDLPMLVPTMLIIFILKVGYVTSAGSAGLGPIAEKALLMQNDLNIGASEVIATYVYKIGLKSQQYSYSAAIGLFNTFIAFAIVATLNKLAKKYGGSSLW
ncbi:MAG: sugar ABC transporter permease [Syntrophomonadaceae bacterium]|nr:sugar ABC transporter permease [Syntrophomonadaceae bacterium]